MGYIHSSLCSQRSPCVLCLIHWDSHLEVFNSQTDIWLVSSLVQCPPATQAAVPDNSVSGCFSRGWRELQYFTCFRIRPISWFFLATLSVKGLFQRFDFWEYNTDEQEIGPASFQGSCEVSEGQERLGPPDQVRQAERRRTLRVSGRDYKRSGDSRF